MSELRILGTTDRKGCFNRYKLRADSDRNQRNVAANVSQECVRSWPTAGSIALSTLTQVWVFPLKQTSMFCFTDHPQAGASPNR